jgi:predicted nucleotide-binding protein
MPFTETLTQIYKAFVKPTIENPEFGLICRRADDIKSNRAVIQDVWKSLCEARIVIADLTKLNPNVMYELGIAHTLGKETILIYQRGEEDKFPFDLSHIRRIEYDNDALGGRKLEEELKATISHILEPQIRA